MEKMIEKISGYDILTNIIPGYVFCFVASRIGIYEKMLVGSYQDILMVYFVGMIMSRISSVIMEPILYKLRVYSFKERCWKNIMKKASYSEYVEAEAGDTKIEVLNTSRNMYRSLMAVFLTLIITKAVDMIRVSINYNFLCLIGLMLLFVLFLISFSKQNNCVFKRIMIWNCRIEKGGDKNE